MGVWSLAILDSGVVNETEALYGANASEWDFYYGDSDTDGGRTTSHGSLVAQVAEQTNSALERIDLQVMSNGGSVGATATINAISHLSNLHDAGWHIGAVNLSWGGSLAYSPLAAGLTNLAARGIVAVAAAGNSGSHSGLEAPIYPAAYSNVIAVGSHDGSGNPTSFSNNHPSYIHVLADGENMPGAGISGTSFAAPQVAAGVATVQALADAALERRLTFGETVDVLQQGGGATQSNVDPANGSSRYYLFDHGRSLDYFLRSYLDPQFSGYEYMASYGDLEAAFAGNPGAARAHLLSTGVYEGREVGFDGLEYIASHGDLIGAFGANRELGALHYLGSGRAEGRTTSFDGESYLAANADLRAAFGTNVAAATRHYITNGYYEGRPTSGTVSSPGTTAVSEGASDLPAGTGTPGYVGVGASASGTIASSTDRDWFRTDLTAGQTVIIEARGSASGGGTLYDPDVYLRGSSGAVLTYDWDSGAGYDARLVYRAAQSGTFFIDVDGFLSTGSYTVSVTASGSSQVVPAALAEASDRDQLPADLEPLDLAWAVGPSSSVDGIL